MSSQISSVPTQPVAAPTHVFTPRELEFIQATMAITPTGFLKGCSPGFDMNIRLLGMAYLGLSDFNTTNPCTHYTINNYPPELKYLLVLGTQTYMMLMMQAGFALIDINYNDNGFSLSIDRASKIAAAYDKVKEMWEKQIRNYKNCLMLHNGGEGLGTPRFQSNISRTIGILGGGAYGWNIP
jgi:hypothetical protein